VEHVCDMMELIYVRITRLFGVMQGECKTHLIKYSWIIWLYQRETQRKSQIVIVLSVFECTTLIISLMN